MEAQLTFVIYGLIIYAGWVLAVARLTRLITVDEITDPIRIRIIHRFGTESRWTYLSSCAWCMSIWVAAATAPFAIWLSGADWVYYPILVLSASHLTGLLTSMDSEELDIDIEDE